MSNAILSWNNLVSAGFTVRNDGWWTYDASLANLARAALSERWVSPGLAAADTRFTFSLTSTTAVAFIALCSHNLTLAATVRVRGSNVADFASTVYDSGTVNAFATGVTAASRDGLRWNFVHRLSTATAASYWRVEIVDTGNPAGYVTAGRLFCGGAVWQPTVNMLAGAGIGFESNANSMKALNGAEWFVDVEANRLAKFSVQVPESEALASAFDLQRVAAGSNREVVFIYDPADTVHAVRRTLFGRLRQMSLIEAPYHGTSKTAFEIKELL